MKQLPNRLLASIVLVLPSAVVGGLSAWLVAILSGRFTPATFDSPTVWIFLPPVIFFSGALSVVVLYQKMSAPPPERGLSPRMEGLGLVVLGLAVGAGAGFYIGNQSAEELAESFVSDCQRLTDSAGFDTCMQKVERCRKQARKGICAVRQEKRGRGRWNVGPELPDSEECKAHLADRRAEVERNGIDTALIRGERSHRRLSDLCLLEKLGEGEMDP